MKIRDLEWWIVGLLGLLSFFLAFKGFYILFAEAGIERSFIDIAYQSMKIFGMEFVDEYKSPIPWQLEIARWLSPLVLIYAAIKAVLYFIQRELKSLLVKYYNNHVIVTSLNLRTRYLISNLLKEGRKVVVLAGITVKHKLDSIEKEGAVIMEGNISSERFLRNIAAQKASYFVFAENADESNISSTLEIYHFLQKHGKKKPQVLFTHVTDDLKLNELKELNFFEEYTKLNVQINNCEIRIFSAFERASRVIFNKYSPDIFTPINSKNDPQIHVAIVGSGKLAQSMILRFARLGHFANMKKTKITLFHDDERILTRIDRSLLKIQQVLDIESIKEDLDLLDIEIFKNKHEAHPFSAIYLLCEDDEVSSGLLNKITKVESEKPFEVVLTLIDPDGILNKWYAASEINNINLHKFNITEESFTQEALISEKIDALAKIIHQDYLDGIEIKNSKKLSHQPWELLPVDFKNQNREQADHIFVKIRALGGKGYAIKEIENIDKQRLELLSEMEHNRWWAHMLTNGWNFSGDRDDRRKLHNDLIPYEKLPDDVKQYDRNAILNIPKLIQKYEEHK